MGTRRAYYIVLGVKEGLGDYAMHNSRAQGMKLKLEVAKCAVQVGLEAMTA